MRVYFLSCRPAALKLNGIYLGMVDGFERHVELDPKDKVFAEFLPADNFQSVNICLDEKFFKSPPEFADVYLMQQDALVYIRKFSPKDIKLKIIYQTRFCGNLVTLFSQGEVYVSIEGSGYELKALPQSFLNPAAEEKTIGGKSVLSVRGGEILLIISDAGKIVFLNRAESATFGDTLELCVPFETCARVVAECAFSYDGEKFTLISSKTKETLPPPPEVLHFAFFECVLTRGDCTPYLSSELKGKAAALKEYLGEFVDVTIPPEKFYLSHGNIPAAGLVYPRAANLFEVKYFSVTLKDGKIDNIFPVT